MILVTVNQCVSSKSLNNRSFYRRIYLQKRVQRGKKSRATKSRLKSRWRNQLSSTNFPFGAERHPERWRFHGIARPAARNRFPARGAEEHYVEPSPVVEVDAGSCIPGGAILSGKLFRPNEDVPVPANALVDISKLLVVAPLRSRNPPSTRLGVPVPRRGGREQNPLLSH